MLLLNVYYVMPVPWPAFPDRNLLFTCLLVVVNTYLMIRPCIRQCYERISAKSELEMLLDVKCSNE